MTTLRLTDAGRAALADGANRQVNNVQLRAFAIGDGTGPGGAADDARVALRSQQAREALTGTTAETGRLAVRATFVPTTVYSVTEAGIIARIGDAGAEFLLAYWASSAARNALATTVSGVTLVIAGVLDITRAAAEIDVDVGVNITLGGPGRLVSLSDVADVFSAGLYLRANNTGTAAEWDEAPPVVEDEDSLPLPAAAVNSLYLLQRYDDAGEPALAMRSGNRWWYSATRRWVEARLAALIGAAPAALDTIYELAAEIQRQGGSVAGLMRDLAGRVRKAGDTMTGALNLVTPAANDNSKKAANTEWVRARLEEVGVAIPQKYLFYDGSGAGLVISDADAGVAVAMSESLAGFRFIELFGIVVPTGASMVTRAVRTYPVGVLDIPTARNQLFRLHATPNDHEMRQEVQVEAWRPSAREIRLRARNPPRESVFQLRAVIGWSDPA